MRRIRIARVRLVIEAYLDDGDELHPVEVAPLDIPGSEFATLDPAGIIAALQEQADQASS